LIINTTANIVKNKIFSTILAVLFMIKICGYVFAIFLQEPEINHPKFLLKQMGFKPSHQF